MTHFAIITNAFALGWFLAVVIDSRDPARRRFAAVMIGFNASMLAVLLVGSW